jgi:hypothetical protein
MFLISPPVNSDNGMIFDPQGRDTLPPGTWHVDTELLDLDLTGTLFESTFEPIRIRKRVEIAIPGEIMLMIRADGSWQVDSFFDIAYRIDFPETGMTLVPQGGSTLVSSTETHAGPIDRLKWSNIVLKQYIGGTSGSDNILINANNPQEIWDYIRGLQTQAPQLDWGDAPDAPYPTLAASAGAAHVIRPGYSMGTVDDEPDGQPSPLATLDDATGVPDDEDGVVLTSLLTPGSVATVDVTATGGLGFLNAWADFDRDGAWEPAEQIFTSLLLNVGVNSLTFLVPAATRPDATGVPPVIFRARFSRQEVLPPTGLSSSGEVEDYHLRIAPGPQGSPAAEAAADVTSPRTATVDDAFAQHGRVLRVAALRSAGQHGSASGGARLLRGNAVDQAVAASGITGPEARILRAARRPRATPRRLDSATP